MTHLLKARAAWGEALPVWVEHLARRADATSQGRTAKEIGYSAATVSYVIGARYAGDLAKVEERVRATLMNGVIDCPEMGPLALSQCLEWRLKSREFVATSTLRRVMFRACQSCHACTENAKGGQ